MTIYFCSDHHFGHKNIINFAQRPFISVEEMNLQMLARHNALVMPWDTCYFVGDLAMGSFVDSMAWAARLNGHKILVPGNHDRCHPSYHGADRRDEYERAGFTIAPTEFDLTITSRPSAPSKRETFRVCHFPYDRDERHGEKHVEFNPADAGKWLIHGHVHEQWKVRGRQINVGVDQWEFYPVSEDQILALV